MMGDIVDVPGVQVGHWADRDARTGCSVVIPPTPNVAACEVRGAAPGTREVALLAPGMRVTQVDALVLTGGSAFGLAAADGVVRRLAAEGRGHPTPAGPVPIVPAAVVFDRMVGSAHAPDAGAGAAAFDAASRRPTSDRRAGVGAGATVAKWRGSTVDGGLGSASVMVGGATVGALVVVNAVGDVFTLEGLPLTGGELVPGPPLVGVGDGTNTTLAVVATDARLDRPAAGRVAVRAQDAFSVCIRPSHTGFDGDLVFVVSCGDVEVAAVDLVAEAAWEAVGRAIEAAVGSPGPPP